MNVAEVFETNQAINDRLAVICDRANSTEENRSAVAGEIRALVTRLCLAVIEGNATTSYPVVKRDLEVPVLRRGGEQ